MPALPPQAFLGGLRKLELYFASSPAALRLAAGEKVRGDSHLLYDWAIPLPTSLTGSSQVMTRIPDANGTRCKRRRLHICRHGHPWSSRPERKEFPQHNSRNLRKAERHRSSMGVREPGLAP
ncbi:hypothetical protein FGB62_5g527 [Gracilaria domingensis]|nr:hypothetical protein FGB62_5g527 [Gracilaria domingensis]